MNLFGMGPMEVILILLVALLVFGPHKIPEIGRDLGKTIRSFRRATEDISRDVSRQIEEEVEATQRAVESPSDKEKGAPGSIPTPSSEAGPGQAENRP